MKHFIDYLQEIKTLTESINLEKYERIVSILLNVKNKKGRVFCVGIGGSAGNCSHLVNDLRKLCNIDAITPLDNMPEFSARINDDGWDSALINSIKISNISKKDALFILSVGGGNKKKNVSVNLIKCIDYFKEKSVSIIGIVGKKDGYTYKNSQNIIHIPVKNKKYITPISESFQSIVWHALVSDMRLQVNSTKW